MPSWTLPTSDCRDKLEEYMQALPLEEVDFVVLFGSPARGQGGELDILIGLHSDGKSRFIDRLQLWSGLGPGVKALPYYPAELTLMREQLHLVLLDAADHGHTLFDRGVWQELRRDLRENAPVERIPGGGWKVVTRHAS